MARRKDLLRQLDQDIRGHLERETSDNIERGMTPEEARYAALRKFGNIQQIKEQTREVWGMVALEQFLQDVRYSLRNALALTPGKHASFCNWRLLKIQIDSLCKNPPILAGGLFNYSISRGRFLRFRLRARASFVRRFSPGFR
jgi:hypothetical protein